MRDSVQALIFGAFFLNQIEIYLRASTGEQTL